MRIVLRRALLLERRLLLVRDLARLQHLDEPLGQVDVLDVDAARLDVVAGEVALDVLLGLVLHRVARLDERHRREALERVAEVVADRALQHLVDEVLHRPDHADHLRRLRVRHVDLHLQVDVELEALAALAVDRRERRVEVVRLRSSPPPSSA